MAWTTLAGFYRSVVDCAVRGPASGTRSQEESGEIVPGSDPGAGRS
jgi:hypothetical protein